MGNITLQGGTAAADPTSEVYVSAAIPYPVGTRAHDSRGNGFLFVNFGEAVIQGEWVAVDQNLEATQLKATSRGRVGVVIAATGTSDQSGWVQTYGLHTAAWASCEATTGAPVTVGATTDLGYIGLPTTTQALHVAVRGVLIRSTPDTCASTALSTSALAAPCTVELNEPFIDGTTVESTS